ncbi:ATPase AAA [Oenococcus oeni S13]|uniref:replication-associated recombination protein A n=1 Tax=Oenococcus oeni TaxID=1247 RepID=UPI00050F1FCB|nr:replication-associated recombination protein A [Oenococcus oeni]KGH62091.1 ATPase AAA [Oenococcus oeni S13]
MIEQASLFENNSENGRPLASRVRPQTLEQFVGQENLLGPGKVLRELIEKDQISSMIFWGPPGVGKTTLAEIIAHRSKAKFITFSAATSGIKEIRKIMKDAENNRQFGVRTIVFIDEIHRFNKAQQDSFLPYVEQGSIILIGATTENPSFEINSALLSRSKVFVLRQLKSSDIVKLLENALKNPHGFAKQKISISSRTLQLIADFANGDARTALNTLEMAVLNGHHTKNGTEIKTEDLKQLITKKSLLYDKHGEEHYNIISALHKSMRNSDVDAAIYWLARMLESGEDPLYVARRLIRFASEDIGLADSRALEITVAAYQASQLIGMPECTVNLTQAVTYLALAPKSNSLYTAYGEAKSDAQKSFAEPVPLQIRNAPTKLMKELHYGENYQYAHSSQDKLTSMQTMPENLLGHHYYHPSSQGSEIKMKTRLEQIARWHEEHDPKNQ